MSDPTAHNDSKSPSALPQPSATYQKYLSLQTKNAPCAGMLLLCSGMDHSGAEWAMAATIAGAAFLGIDADMQRLKLAQQNRACDFVVNSLNEALRILKNQIRKRQPIAVGLHGNPAEILQQIVERGVQPEFIVGCGDMGCGDDAQPTAMQLLLDRGAQWLDAIAATAEATREPVRWTAADARDLPHMDALVATILPANDHVRSPWLLRAPSYFVRQRPPQRVLTLTPEEISSVTSAMGLPAWRAQLRQSITFFWGTTSRRIEPVR